MQQRSRTMSLSKAAVLHNKCCGLPRSLAPSWPTSSGNQCSPLQHQYKTVREKMLMRFLFGAAGGSSLQNLHAMVEGVSHDDAPVAADGDAATRVAELSVACAFAADGANMGAVAVAQHLHAMVACFNYNNVTGGIERDARGTVELASACSYAADGADMGAVAVAQHLHAMVALINYNNVTGDIERDARGILELAGACSSAADGADMRAVAVAQHLHAMVIVGNNKVAFDVKRHTTQA